MWTLSRKHLGTAGGSFRQSPSAPASLSQSWEIASARNGVGKEKGVLGVVLKPRIR